MHLVIHDSVCILVRDSNHRHYYLHDTMGRYASACQRSLIATPASVESNSRLPENKTMSKAIRPSGIASPCHEYLGTLLLSLLDLGMSLDGIVSLHAVLASVESNPHTKFRFKTVELRVYFDIRTKPFQYQVTNTLRSPTSGSQQRVPTICQFSVHLYIHPFSYKFQKSYPTC